MIIKFLIMNNQEQLNQHLQMYGRSLLDPTFVACCALDEGKFSNDKRLLVDGRN